VIDFIIFYHSLLHDCCTIYGGNLRASASMNCFYEPWRALDVGVTWCCSIGCIYSMFLYRCIDFYFSVVRTIRNVG